MTDTPQVLLAHHLKALKLPTFVREYDKVARQCAAEGTDYPRYLLRLAELELIDRERCMVERRIPAPVPIGIGSDSFADGHKHTPQHRPDSEEYCEPAHCPLHARRLHAATVRGSVGPATAVRSCADSA